ncbi:MAG TPA: helix-hairpin-helix domain-containing protein [Nocardioides sp.]|nr:helix-hairpin-helix domain-containing protein [Nocardioides sp.]
MPARRGPASDARAEAAARRLALIAADAGGEPEPWWADHTRVAQQPPAPPPLVVVASPQDEQEPALAPPLPQPGRHAARRRWRPALPRPDLPGIGPAHVAVVAVVVAVGLAFTTWWVTRDRAEPLAPVSAEPVTPLVGAAAASGAATSGPAGPSAGATTTVASGGKVTVDVAGRVRHPGIVVLDQGARVTDALEAAGGARHGVDLTPLNLARVLVDGEQVVVGGPAAGAAGAAGAGAAAAGAAGAVGGPGGGAVAGPLVNLNTAAQSELETLPGVGPVTAQAIIAWREQHGGFTSIEELTEVDGIGEKTLATLAPHVTV